MSNKQAIMYRKGEFFEEINSSDEEEKREVLREKARMKRKEKQKVTVQRKETVGSLPLPLPAKASSSSESSSSSTESEPEPSSKRVLLKPVFKQKANRVITKETLIQDQLFALQKQNDKLDIKRLQAQELVVEALEKEILDARQTIETFDIDDTDGLDVQEEEDAWKVRELLRIKRDREQREYRLVDDEDILRRRFMTDEQIVDENTKDGKLGIEKRKMKFMQKYTHAGAFFTGDEQVEEAKAKVDFIAPTLGDHQDKEILPAVMQVKKFGLAGRTKYTHLVDQDTTGLDTAWAKSVNMSQQVMNKMGGMGTSSGFEKPTKKRKTDS